METTAATTPPAPIERSREVVEIRPPTRWGSLNLRDVLSYRELLYFITRREIIVRYKQSLFGIAWAVLQPLAMMAIFYIFFGRLADIPSDGVPYPVFALAALVPWTFFSQAVTQSAASLVTDANILSKVYFPRLILPIGRVLSMLVDLVIASVVMLLFMLLFGLTPGIYLLLAPAFVALAFLGALGAGTLLAAINVRYRDVAVAVPLMLQLWLFATPVVYPGSLVTGAWEYVYAANPMVSVISGFRWAVLETPGPSPGAVGVSIFVAVLMLVVAAVYFRRTERYFADII